MDTRIIIPGGSIHIRDLADREEDVPVYSMEEISQEVCVQWARHPQIADTHQKLVRVHLSDGGHVDVSADFMFLTNDGKFIKASKLRAGDSLPAFNKVHDISTSVSKVYNNGLQSYKLRDDTRAATISPGCRCGVGIASCGCAVDTSPHAMLEKMDLKRNKWRRAYFKTLKQYAKQLGYTLNMYPDGTVKIVRICEQCGRKFPVAWKERERIYCSESCIKRRRFNIEERRRHQRSTLHGKMKDTFHRQVTIYNDLAKNNNGIVDKKAWEQRCASQGVSYLFNRLADNKPWTASSWEEFQDLRDKYEKRVVRVERRPGTHTVYTVSTDSNNCIAVLTMNTHSSQDIIATGIFVPCIKQ